MKPIKLICLIACLYACGSSFAQSSTQAFAPIGSHWNYWFAEESFYGYIHYEVVADTFVKAAIYEFPNDTLAVRGSVIQKTKYSTFTPQGVKTGSFIACRQGNKAYLMEKRKKQWFKWIDMDAQAGDKWLMIETANNSQGIIDYVEVSYRDTLTMDGKKIPVIRMMPSCTSRFSTNKDFTSRIRMSGYYNIDFLSINYYPEVYANGLINLPIPEVIFVGLLCAQNGDKTLATPNLERYVKSNNAWMYEKGIVDCDSLQAPPPRDKQMSRSNFLTNTQNFTLGVWGENIQTDPRHFALYEKWEEDHQRILKKSRMTNDNGEELKVPVVVHIVYNPATPEEKISETQVHKFLEKINQAYTTTKEQEVRADFKNVVGNPNIKFVLANRDPENNPSSGILYHTTKTSYFPMIGDTSIVKKYAFKFDENGQALNWDNEKYINIYVADLGGMEGKSNIGGFVTQPVATDKASGDDLLKWLSGENSRFWEQWIVSDEAKKLDGLTVDTWYTFGGAQEKNPQATCKTAIHELGHYFGIRHPNIILITNDGKTLVLDDGFEDTPLTHYTQYAETACDNPVMQCGNLVQVENYMDYALPCACMFSKEQSAYMRTFLKDCRKNMQADSTVKNIQIAAKKTICLYPNPNQGEFYLQLNEDWHTPEISVFTLLGNEIPIVKRGNGTEFQISSSVFKSGLYILKVKDKDRVETRIFSIK
ncbi:MAG: zinc-dependent metalloprotease [Bacteroidales bacterium]